MQPRWGWSLGFWSLTWGSPAGARQPQAIGFQPPLGLMNGSRLPLDDFSLEGRLLRERLKTRSLRKLNLPFARVSGRQFASGKKEGDRHRGGAIPLFSEFEPCRGRCVIADITRRGL